MICRFSLLITFLFFSIFSSFVSASTKTDLDISTLKDFKNSLLVNGIIDFNFSNPDLEYSNNFEKILSEKIFKYDVVLIFKKEATQFPEFLYSLYSSSLNRLNEISNDKIYNNRLLKEALLELYSKNEITSLSSDNNKFSCLCLEEGTCGDNDNGNCSSPNQSTIEPLIPIASVGVMGHSLTSYDEEDIIAGSNLNYDSSLAAAWLTNEEFNMFNYARDLSVENVDSGWTRYNQTHPFEQIGVHHAYGRGLSGSGVTLGVMDLDICVESGNTHGWNSTTNVGETHFEIANKNITIFSNYDESQWFGNGSYNMHGCHVATTAVGSYHGNVDQSSEMGTDIGTGDIIGIYNSDDYDNTMIPSRTMNSMMGVAYNANLWQADVDPPDGFRNYNTCTDDSSNTCWGPQHWELAYENAIGSSVSVMSNSWYHGDGDLDVRTIESTAISGDLTNYQAMQAHRAIDTDGDTIWDVGNAGAGASEVTWTALQWEEYVDALNNFQNTGVIVWASSNDNENEMSTVYGNALNYSDLNVSMPYLFPQLAEAWISIVNVSLDIGGSGTRKLLSAPCAVNAAYCLSHDGYNVVAGTDAYTTSGSWYNAWNGTSMATPQVSGSVALLSEAFPDNNPELITKRLFLTADNDWLNSYTCYLDTDTDGNKYNNYCGGFEGTLTFNGISHSYNQIYGHGNINLHKALSPIGSTRVNLKNREYPLVGSLLVLSNYYGDALLLNDHQAIFRDQLNGGFQFGLGDLVSSYNDNLLSEKLNKRKYDEWNSIRNSEESLTLSFSYESVDLNNNGLMDEVGFYSSFQTGNQTIYTGHNYSIDQILGLVNSNNAFSVLSSHNNNSFLSLTEVASNGQIFGSKFDIVESTSLGITTYAGTHEKYDLQEEGFLASINHKFSEYDDVTFFIGQNNESEGLLRTQGSGAFGELSGETTHAGITFNNHLFKNLHIAGLLDYGVVNNRIDNAGFLTDMSDITISQFNLGLVASKISSNSDLFSFNISQPLRTESGSAELNLPGLMDSNGTHSYETKSISLEPSGRELSLDMGYENLLRNGSAFRLGTQYLLDPSHNKDIQNNALIYGTYKISF